jgi:hypothetical protein
MIGGRCAPPPLANSEGRDNGLRLRMVFTHLNPAGQWVRTFAVLTTAAIKMVARIHEPPLAGDLAARGLRPLAGNGTRPA